MLHIFTIEYRGMAPALPVDVCGAEYDELQVATLLEIHHLKPKTKTLQRLGEFSV